MRIGSLMIVAALAVLTVLAGLTVANPRPASAVLVPEDLSGPLTPNDLATQLGGAGVTVSNVTYAGADVAAGRFTGGTGIIGFDAGVVLSSGDIADTVGPNSSDSAGAGNLQPVSINTINNGNPFNTDPRENSALYRNNDVSDGGGSIDTQLDGLTVVLTCTATVNAGVTNHMKLAIADASDEIYDAVVFLEAGSLQVQTPSPSPSPPPGPTLAATASPTASPTPTAAAPAPP